MDDILGQALRSAEIVTSQQNRQIQPRPQRTVPAQASTPQPSAGGGPAVQTADGPAVARAVRTVQYRPVGTRDGQRVLISQHPQNQNRQTTNKILVVQPGNTPVRNVQPGQTLVISSSSNGQNQFQIAQSDLNGTVRGTTQTRTVPSGQIRTIQAGSVNHTVTSGGRPQVVQNGTTSGVRIISGRTRPTPVAQGRTTLIPVSSANQNAHSVHSTTPGGQVRQIMVPVQTYKSTPPQTNPTPRKILIQKGSPNGPPTQQQQRTPIHPQVTPTHNSQTRRVPVRNPIQQNNEQAGRQKVSVQCHEPRGSTPGFIVLQSEYDDNLRSTYTQLQRCFSTSYKDIMEINDNEHALMPKLKDIYRKADQNYRNYLTRNPLKILDNLKTVDVRTGGYITLESYLNSQKTTAPYTVRVRPEPGPTHANSPTQSLRNANVITVTPTRPSTIRFPSSHGMSHGPNGISTTHTIVKRPLRLNDESPEPRKPPKKPTAIQLRLDADHLDQTSLLNINEPFSSVRDFQSRLLPFHCSLPPPVTSRDESHAELSVMEPMCDSILTRKRQMESDFRNKFNRWNIMQAEGEDLLMEKLQIELEMDEIKEKRIKLSRVKQERRRRAEIQNNNHNTVQMPVDDIDEHDNAVKGLLDNF